MWKMSWGYEYFFKHCIGGGGLLYYIFLGLYDFLGCALDIDPLIGTNYKEVECFYNPVISVPPALTWCHFPW